LGDEACRGTFEIMIISCLGFQEAPNNHVIPAKNQSPPVLKQLVAVLCSMQGMSRWQGKKL